LILETLSTLKINKLSQAQYERELAAGRINPNELYLTEDGTAPNIYVQDTEPTNAAVGSFWIDTSETGTLMAEDVSF
jgi:hypothetical protein